MRGFCISGNASFPDRFALLLEQEVNLFLELDGIQEQALQCVQAGAFANLEGLLTRQREVMASLEERRKDLRPMMETWEKLPGPERESLRQGPIGGLLTSMENAAAAIQKRHREQFEVPAAAPSGSKAGEGERDLDLRISRYRAGL